MQSDAIITNLIYPALAEILSGQEIEAASHLRPETVLFGQGSLLDSIGLVSLLAVLEERIQNACNRDIALASDAVFSRAHSPFRTVGTLADFVAELVAK